MQFPESLDEHIVSRRSWLEKVSIASMGVGLLGVATKAFGASSSTGVPGKDNLTGIRIYNICDFGAVGDGKTLCTAALQKAIDACNKDKGGTVVVPAGVFVIGSTELKSNVTLHICAGATLLGSDVGKNYHAADVIPLKGDATLGDGNVGLIYATNAENITIEGKGTIDGQGVRFRHPIDNKELPSPAGLKSHDRPYHLMFYKCKNVIVSDLFLKDCAYHSIRAIQSTRMRFEGLHIYGRVIYNNDGFHFISCEYVHLNNCDVQSQDDACALFGSCKYITVSNSTFSTRWSVFRFGGGRAENITVSNCIIYEVYGCPIKMQCGPNSHFENIVFSDIIMKDVTGPISLGLGSKWRANTDGKVVPGVIRNISFNNLLVTVVKPVPLRDTKWPSKYNPGEMFSCITLNAFGENYLENISLNNVHIQFPGGGTKEQGAVRDVPEVAGEYYQMGIPPAYGIYARNVKGLTLQNIRLEQLQPDLRPAMVFDHVLDAAINGLSAESHTDAESALRFVNCQDILLSATRLLNKATVFLSAEGNTSQNLKITSSDISKAGKQVILKDGAAQQEVVFS